MKTRRCIVVLLLAVGAVLSGAACSDSDHIFDPAPAAIYGNGNVVEQTRAIGACSSLDLQGVGNVYIQQGVREQLRIRAEENLLEYLWTEVQAGELAIWKDGVTLLNTQPIEYHLTVVDLERVALTGAGGIQGSNLDTGPLTLLLSGVGNIELVNLNAHWLDIENTGVGDVILSGSVHEQTIRLRGFGKYDGRNLTSIVADVRIGSGGSATVRVQDHLSATINGSGNVYYLGDPIVESSISGSGGVVKIGE
jgi:hypothetical protein